MGARAGGKTTRLSTLKKAAYRHLGIENRRSGKVTFALRRAIWSDGYSQPDDYYIIHEGRTVGRICRLNSVAKEMWCWTLIGPRAPAHDLNGGVVYSLDEAKAAFWAAYERRPQGLQEWNSGPTRVETKHGESKTFSMMWADKLAIGLFVITAVVAPILSRNLFVYETSTQAVSGAIGLVLVMVAFFVLPLWSVLRIAVWVGRAFRVEAGEGGLPRLR